MKNIKLVECSSDIVNNTLKELYLSKIEYLKKKLGFLDMKGIAGTVILHADHASNRLETRIEVICDDDGYRKVIEEVTKGFNSTGRPDDL